MIKYYWEGSVQSFDRGPKYLIETKTGRILGKVTYHTYRGWRAANYRTEPSTFIGFYREAFQAQNAVENLIENRVEDGEGGA